ncbi:TonB-dependent receptor domain-containing protein [Paludibacterium denitrificans]|uniref:TonB-dependent receptor domain-containing protein n=1 Tax=Paludibacterium denitrificans TaxID=2675226 RepID=UPI001E2EFA6E|nr:TonB-dependent receptor [Paludibacterium denitrificans]
MTFAWRDSSQLLEFKAGIQRTPYEEFPNQRMDMTDNSSNQASLHYLGQFGWGDLDARIYNQYVRHSMNFGDDKQLVYGIYKNGMPMETSSHTLGGTVTADIALSDQHRLKVGGEVVQYRLDDWWPAAGGMGGMGPNTFWNINDGTRDRFDIFSEWQADWTPEWRSTLGARLSQINMNAADVAGYNTGMMYGPDAAAFNARDHHKVDRNIDLSAALRYLLS